MAHMDESCHIRSSHEWVVSHMNESCHIWMSHVSYEWVVSHMNESCLIWIRHLWMSHLTCEWVMSHMICVFWFLFSPCPVDMCVRMRMRCMHVFTYKWETCEWVMSRMNQPCHVCWVFEHLFPPCPIAADVRVRMQGMHIRLNMHNTHGAYLHGNTEHKFDTPRTNTRLILMCLCAIAYIYTSYTTLTRIKNWGITCIVIPFPNLTRHNAAGTPVSSTKLDSFAVRAIVYVYVCICTYLHLFIHIYI